MTQPLIFSDFAPDLDSITPGACQDMSNVYPTQSGFFRTLPGLQLVGQGLNSHVFGGFTGLLIDQPITAAATQNALFIWQNEFFGNSTIVPTTTQNRRRFAIYGNLIIAVDGVNPPYYYSSGPPGTGAFVPFPVWPGGFTGVPSIVETTDYATILVQANSQQLWSSLAPLGDSTLGYTPSVPEQIYLYNLGQLPGDITAVHRLRSLLVVYRQNAFQCATFVGVDIGWDFGSPGTISEDIGAAGNECVINTGDYHYIWGPDDFWQFDGYNLNRIPNNLKQFIFRDLDQGFFANVAGRYDINRTLVFWHYPSVNASPRGSLDSYVCLNLRTGKWGFGRLSIDLPLIGVMNDPLSPQTTPDSGVFLPDHNLYLYDELAQFAPSTTLPNPGAGQNTYTPLTYITSNDFGDRHMVYSTRRLRPGFAQYPVPALSTYPTPVMITPLVQQKLTGTPPVAAFSTPISDDGWGNLKVTARLQRFRFDLYGTCEFAQGDVDINPTGAV